MDQYRKATPEELLKSDIREACLENVHVTPDAYEELPETIWFLVKEVIEEKDKRIGELENHTKNLNRRILDFGYDSEEDSFIGNSIQSKLSNSEAKIEELQCRLTHTENINKELETKLKKWHDFHNESDLESKLSTLEARLEVALEALEIASRQFRHAKDGNREGSYCITDCAMCSVKEALEKIKESM